MNATTLDSYTEEMILSVAEAVGLETAVRLSDNELREIHGCA